MSASSQAPVQTAPAAATSNKQVTRTLVLWGVALVVLLVAVVPRLRNQPTAVDPGVGQPLFPDFTDPSVAAVLEITEYDEETAMLKRPFRIEKREGLWRITSHSDYPADAERHFADAAASLVNVQKLAYVSDSPGDHPLYGVVEPDPLSLEAGSTGVGKRITFESGDGVKLVNLIIGKQVDPDKNANLRFVRIPGQDQVYTAEIDAGKFTTRFSDWIETDLLGLRSWDIRGVTLNNYSFDLEEVRRTQQLPKPDTIRLTYNDSDGRWSMEGLAEDQELDTIVLNDMRNALGDLKIVDVQPKPAGFRDGLRAGDQLVGDQEAVDSLFRRGFVLIPLSGPDGGVSLELFSTEGEAIVQAKDGVEYVLRFGQLALNADRNSSESDSDTADDEQKKDQFIGSNRYLFVTANFNPDLIEKPQYEPLPEAGPSEPADDTPPADKPADKPAENSTDQPADKPAEPASDDSGAAPAAADGLLALADEAADTETPADDAKKSEEPKSSDEAPAAETPADNPTDTPAEKPADTPAAESDEAPTPPADAEKPDDQKKETDQRREEIEKENERKRKEYEDKIEAGQKRVAELNERFAPWYYVISDDVYRKIRLSRDRIVKAKTPAPTDPAAEPSDGASDPDAPAPPDDADDTPADKPKSDNP